MILVSSQPIADIDTISGLETYWARLVGTLLGPYWDGIIGTLCLGNIGTGIQLDLGTE